MTARARKTIAAVPDPPIPVKRGPGRPRKDGTPAQPRNAAPRTGSLREAAQISERAALVKLRDMAADQLDARPSGAVFAAVAKQFRECDAAVRAFDSRRRNEADEDADDDEADGWDEAQL